MFGTHLVGLRSHSTRLAAFGVGPRPDGASTILARLLSLGVLDVGLWHVRAGTLFVGFGSLFP